MGNSTSRRDAHFWNAPMAQKRKKSNIGHLGFTWQSATDVLVPGLTTQQDIIQIFMLIASRIAGWLHPALGIMMRPAAPAG